MSSAIRSDLEWLYSYVRELYQKLSKEGTNEQEQYSEETKIWTSLRSSKSVVNIRFYQKSPEHSW